jgi:hypothetical protein
MHEGGSAVSMAKSNHGPPNPTEAGMKTKRSSSTTSTTSRGAGAVTVAGWLAILAVPIMVMRAGMLLLSGELAGISPGELTEPQQWQLVQMLNAALVAIIVVSALVSLVAGIGILRRKRWAWVALTLMLAVGLTFNLGRYYYRQPEFSIMLLYGIIALALNQGDVRRMFNIGKASDEPVE